MPHLTHHCSVNADLQTIWTVLLDRIEHPERYQTGVESVKFPESTEEYALRELIVEGVPLRERITIDEPQGEIHYTLVDDPLFVGGFCTALIPPAPDDPRATPVVQFRMNWTPLNDAAVMVEQEALPMLEESIKKSVSHVKDMAEKMMAAQLSAP